MIQEVQSQTKSLMLKGGQKSKKKTQNLFSNENSIARKFRTQFVYNTWKVGHLEGYKEISIFISTDRYILKDNLQIMVV